MHPALKRLDLPPVWLAVHLVAAWLLSLISPAFFGSVGRWLGVALVLAGLALTFAAVREMVRSKTTIIPRRDPSSLVTSGVFQHSRNPIYLSDALILLGAVLWFDAILALPLVALFCWLIQTRFIRDEEARLTLAFGPEFDLWAGRTRRWIGRK